VPTTCVTSLELGDQAEVLMNATTVSEMTQAAQRLRLTALNVRRLLMRPLLGEAFLQLSPSVLDPERRRMELADLAVDVVTAADYLLTLLGEPTRTSSRFRLATEAGSGAGRGPSDGEAADHITRRRLDARSTAVRLGMRLLAGLHSDVERQLWESSLLDGNLTGYDNARSRAGSAARTQD
jgi:hypothetical protein